MIALCLEYGPRECLLPGGYRHQGFIGRLARVVRPGGRLAITDIIVPEGCDGDFQNDVERVRDPSHTITQELNIENDVGILKSGMIFRNL